MLLNVPPAVASWEKPVPSMSVSSLNTLTDESSQINPTSKSAIYSRDRHTFRSPPLHYNNDPPISVHTSTGAAGVDLSASVIISESGYDSQDTSLASNSPPTTISGAPSCDSSAEASSSSATEPFSIFINMTEDRFPERIRNTPLLQRKIRPPRLDIDYEDILRHVKIQMSSCVACCLVLIVTGSCLCKYYPNSPIILVCSAFLIIVALYTVRLLYKIPS